MGDIKLPRHMFLWSMSVIYMFAFASLYVQIPGLYGNEGILPARWQMRYLGKSLLEQLKDSPTLLWLGPQLALDTQQGMELICLLGATLAFGAMVLEPLRGSLVFFSLWVLYRSVYQVGQVFLYFQWDSLLLEAGFLAILVAPLNLLWQFPAKHHDATTFWLVRWLLFRLMFASGVVKLTSRCPTWWGLTALTYHYETQCLPSPLAWYAHQLPVWFQKLSVVGTFIIEIPIPFLFFAPIRRLRIFAFYLQVLLQVLIILTGNYNFFNLLTIILCFSLLDDDHVNFWLIRGKKTKEKSGYQAVISWTAFMIELGVYGLIFYWTILYFGLEINWEKKTALWKTEFTYHQFNSFLKMVTVPSIWLGMLSLAWEVVKAMYKCACIQGFFWKLWATVQWAIFATAAAGMFAISLVPYTYIEYDSHGNLWPGLQKAYSAVDRYHLVGSYGLFRRMTGVGGRPEVVIEGSMDKNTWTEIEFMYKPGNVSGPQPIVAPHQPRLDWQMWFAALGPHTQSPWFPSLVYRLLQGKKDVINLIQVDESQYPFRQQPPTFIRALLYKYWFTDTQENGWFPQRWWRRRYVEGFFPTVHLGDPFLDGLLTQYGLKALSADPVTLPLVFRTVFPNLVVRDPQTVHVFAPCQTVHIFAPSQLLDKGLTRRNSDATVPWLLRLVREHIQTMSGPLVLWSLFSAGATICLLKTLFSSTPKESKSVSSKPNSGKTKETAPPSSKKHHVQKKEEDLSPGHKEEKVQHLDNDPK